MLNTKWFKDTNLLPCTLVDLFEIFFGDLGEEFANVFLDLRTLFGRSIVGVELWARSKTCDCPLEAGSGVKSGIANQLAVNLSVTQEVAGLIKDVGAEMITNAVYVVCESLRVCRSRASCACLSMWSEKELGGGGSAS